MISSEKITNLKHQTSNGGFTLIETLLAVLLLTSAIAGPLTIASHGLTASITAKDQITGFYLAQDAMEQVRFVRDSNCLAAGSSSGCPAGSWLSGLGACISTDGSASCYLDSLATNPSVATACTGACPVMRYDATNNYFNYNSSMPATSQQFVRTVSIQNNPSGTTPDEAVVTVKVSWVDVADVTHPPVTIRENIFRWQ